MLTIQPPDYRGPGTWFFWWSSTLTAPVYRVYVDGVLVSTQEAAEITLPLRGGETVEILDDPLAVPADAFPAVAVLGWPADPDAVRYLVEEYVDAAWVERDMLYAQTDEPWIAWTSRVLEDVTTHQFRVTAYDAAGNASTALALSVFMVRAPEPPAVTYVYNPDDGTLTVAAA
jgi:hypothetical protein